MRKPKECRSVETGGGVRVKGEGEGTSERDEGMLQAREKERRSCTVRKSKQSNKLDKNVKWIKCTYVCV